MSIQQNISRVGIERFQTLYRPKAQMQRSTEPLDENADKRSSVRYSCHSDAWADFDKSAPALPVTILNHSSSGILIALEHAGSIPRSFTLSTGCLHYEVAVVWRKRNMVGTRIAKRLQAYAPAREREMQRQATASLVSRVRNALAS